MIIDYEETFASRLGEHELLSIDEERRLSELVRLGRDAQKAIDAGRDSSVLRTAVQEGISARNRLVQANQRLVMMLAGRYASSWADRMDLVQEGNVALLRAAEKFDGRKGFRFSTYADNWISAYMAIYSAESRSPIRIPKKIVAMKDTARHASDSLEILLNRVPSEEEVSALSGLTIDEILKVGRLPQTTSMDAPLAEDVFLSLLDLIPDVLAVDPENEALICDERHALVEAIQRLDEPDRTIVELRYGLRSAHRWPLCDIARELGMSLSAVSSRAKESLALLREYL